MVLLSLAVALIGSVPLMLMTDQTSMVWIALILFVRGISVGGINLPLTSDAYLGIPERQLAEAGVGINIIENVGSSFGSALIATIVATIGLGNHGTVQQQLAGFHAGFLVSVIVLLLLIGPALKLSQKK